MTIEEIAVGKLVSGLFLRQGVIISKYNVHFVLDVVIRIKVSD